jgi:hypothetical protein
VSMVLDSRQTYSVREVSSLCTTSSVYDLLVQQLVFV